jgi:alpha/beta superfamily hydrolase
VEHLRLTTSDGVELEAELEIPDGAIAVAVIAHPHPLYGGSMRDGMPAALFEHLPTQGIAALRFSFRGVEGSGGVHGHGVDERHDVAAAIEAAPDLPVVACGYSFGADISLAVDSPRLRGWCGIAPPLGVVPPEEMVAAHDPRPKLLLVPEQDQYDPPERARTITEAWTSTTVEVVATTDHFLGGAMGRIAEAVTAFVRSLA